MRSKGSVLEVVLAGENPIIFKNLRHILSSCRTIYIEACNRAAQNAVDTAGRFVV